MIAETNTELIVKSLTGSLSKKEEDIFQAWLRESERNRIHYQKIRILWERTNESYNSTEFDEAAAKNKIRSEILRMQSKTRILKTRFRISAAASVLLLLGFGLVLFRILDPDTKNFIVYTSDHNVREILLPDSSLVWLNENSVLRTPEVFSGIKRQAVLDGEAYFQIAKDETRPFKIKAGNTVIKVLGTSFDINMERENGDVSIVVNSGRVSFNRVNSLQNNIILAPGTKGQYRASDHKITISTNSDQNYLSWKTGLLTFYDTPLAEVCTILSEHYKTKVKTTIEDKSLSLTGSFQDEALEDILKTIELTLDIRVSASEEEFLIHKQ